MMHGVEYDLERAFRKTMRWVEIVKTDEEREFWRRCSLSIKEALAYMDLAKGQPKNRRWETVGSTDE